MLLWKNLRKHRSQATYAKNKVGRNYYSQIMMKAKSDFEKDVIKVQNDQCSSLTT